MSEHKSNHNNLFTTNLQWGPLSRPREAEEALAKLVKEAKRQVASFYKGAEVLQEEVCHGCTKVTYAQMPGVAMEKLRAHLFDRLGEHGDLRFNDDFQPVFVFYDLRMKTGPWARLSFTQLLEFAFVFCLIVFSVQTIWPKLFSASSSL